MTFCIVCANGRVKCKQFTTEIRCIESLHFKYVSTLYLESETQWVYLIVHQLVTVHVWYGEIHQ